MSTLESAVRHDLRLTILGDLAYGGPRKATELTGRIGLPVPAVAYHLAVLRSHRLTARDEKSDVYTATLNIHPPWVEEAVAAHRLAKRISLGLPDVANLEMTCFFCGRLLQIEERTIAVYDDGGGTRRAEVVPEGTREDGETDGFRPTAKYHPVCYELARRKETMLPPVEAQP
ncbi:MAG TPA: winged helix-turn-helix domain-containing protein [Solirubrobacterales bacterium]|nr:winged helix-turn-helix domain-containing protein [Solirubrobacterales bacterium]